MEHATFFRIPENRRNLDATPSVKEKRNIAVTGTGRGSGVSLIAGLLAAWIRRHESGETVTLAELGIPYFYDAYGVEKRFLHREFIPFYRMIVQKRSIKNLSNTEEGINWVLRCPADRETQDDSNGLSVADRLRLIHNVSGTLRLFDCSGMPVDQLWEILPEMDAVVCVVDPLPSGLIPAAGKVERLRLDAPHVVWVVNKMNKGVHKGELKRFLGKVPWEEIPCLPPEDLYRAQYNCVLPYALLPVKQKTDAPLRQLWTQLQNFV